MSGAASGEIVLEPGALAEDPPEAAAAAAAKETEATTVKLADELRKAEDEERAEREAKAPVQPTRVDEVETWAPERMFSADSSPLLSEKELEILRGRKATARRAAIQQKVRDWRRLQKRRLKMPKGGGAPPPKGGGAAPPAAPPPRRRPPAAGADTGGARGPGGGVGSAPGLWRAGAPAAPARGRQVAEARREDVWRGTLARDQQGTRHVARAPDAGPTA